MERYALSYTMSYTITYTLSSLEVGGKVLRKTGDSQQSLKIS